MATTTNAFNDMMQQFLDELVEPQRQAFEDDYAGRVLLAYPPRADATTLFPFRRLFMVARKRPCVVHARM